MNNIWHNYKSTLLLLLGILLGGAAGAMFPQVAPVLQPIGDIFMNLLFVMIVPMVLFSVSSSICNLSARKSLGRTLGVSLSIMFTLMVLLSVITYLGVRFYPPVDEGLLSSSISELAEDRSIGSLIVDAVTVTDFCMLLSVKHILPLMIVSGLLGWASSKMQTNRPAVLLQNGCDLVMKMMDLLMIVAPLGLGCYFASMMAEGSWALMTGYGRFLGLYLALTALIYLVLNPFIALLSMGKRGVPAYWRAILRPSLMAISTLSSSASMPSNIAAAREMGVRSDLAESIVPLGTQVYKVGSVVSGVMKVGFVMLLCGQDITSPEAAFLMIGVGFLSSVVVGAVPTGAGTAELLICSILGADPSIVGLLMVTSTIIDMPATLLNVTGNTTLTVAANRLIRE